MRILPLFLAVVLSGSINAQDFPEPPATPSTNNQHTSVTTSVSNSTSVSDSDDTYKFKSKFQVSKRAGILSMLEDEFDTLKVTKKGEEIIWTKYVDGKLAFECKLTKRNLRMFSSKNKLTSSFNKSIKYLGEELSNFIAAHKAPEFPKVNSKHSLSSAQLRLESAKEELEKSIENLERIKRKGNN